jgi:hypothetical protein
MNNSPRRPPFESRDDGIELGRATRHISAPPRALSRASSVAELELRACIETWMNEGGAGGDVNQSRLLAPFAAEDELPSNGSPSVPKPSTRQNQ